MRILSRRWPAAVRKQVRAALASSYQSGWKSESIRELEVFARRPAR